MEDDGERAAKGSVCLTYLHPLVVAVKVALAVGPELAVGVVACSRMDQGSAIWRWLLHPG